MRISLYHKVISLSPIRLPAVHSWPMESVTKATSCCPSWDLSCYLIQHETYFLQESHRHGQLSPEFRKYWRLISYPTEIEPRSGGRDRGYFEESNQGNIVRTKHISQHNYPPSVIWTKDGYLVIRTDPMFPGPGSSWKLLCVLNLVLLTLCTQLTGMGKSGEMAMPL